MNLGQFICDIDEAVTNIKRLTRSSVNVDHVALFVEVGKLQSATENVARWARDNHPENDSLLGMAQELRDMAANLLLRKQ
jgi:hypothetical protein